MNQTSFQNPTPGQRLESGIRKRWRRFWDGLLLYLTNHIVSRCLFPQLRLAWYRRVMKFDIAPGASVLTDCRFSGRGNLAVGGNTVINNECRLDNREPIRIGSNVSISYGALILTAGHNLDSSRFSYRGASVVIEDYVWVCARATVQPGVTLGRGSVALAGSVVAHTVPPMQVVGGEPARFVKERKSELTYRLHWNPAVPPLG